MRSAGAASGVVATASAELDVAASIHRNVPAGSLAGVRILITGVNGFAAGHLARHCAAQGAEVVGLGKRPAGETELPEGVAAYVQADLRDAAAAHAAVEKAAPERVFHLAASASVAESWRDPAATMGVNLLSAVNLFEAVREAAPHARVLSVGSGEQYGEPKWLPMDEQHPQDPRNPYALSKVAAELVAAFYADVHGLHIVRARAFNHAGPGQADLYVSASFARQIAEAEARAREGAAMEVVTGNLETRRDFTDVRDVVRAYWLLLEAAAPDAYNVCRGESVRTADILATLARLAHIEVEQRTDPQLVREGEVMEIRGTHDKLTEATGWMPEIPLEKTLSDTLDWWRERLAAGAAR
jgi:GDP-4-dehydro-6-deoxy-D-mannose reductase